VKILSPTIQAPHMAGLLDDQVHQHALHLHEGASGTATLKSDRSASVSDMHERARLEVTTIRAIFCCGLFRLVSVKPQAKDEICAIILS
jgi:hypothetical protein